MLMKPMSLSPVHPALLPAPAPALRRGAAAVLRGASRVLQALAQQLAQAPVARPGVGAAVPVLEYHAEAGAPEGALYVDGRLVGHLAGVSRL
ncbi:MAG: hypothetical protein V4792_21200 [Pseudomonadota bacterium]